MGFIEEQDREKRQYQEMVAWNKQVMADLLTQQALIEEDLGRSRAQIAQKERDLMNLEVKYRALKIAAQGANKFTQDMEEPSDQEQEHSEQNLMEELENMEEGVVVL
jgi:hypothetical protein